MIFQHMQNLILSLCELRDHCNIYTDLQLKYQVSYKCKMMYLSKFLSRCCDNYELFIMLIYKQIDIQTDYGNRNYITSSIQVVYNTLYMIYKYAYLCV